MLKIELKEGFLTQNLIFAKHLNTSPEEATGEQDTQLALKHIGI